MEQSIRDRFWDKVERDSKGECWEWTASTFRTGYGAFWVNESMQLAHRVSHRMHGGDMEGLVLHQCHNKLCVNPDHLYLGNHSDNMQDAIERGTFLRGEEKSNAKLTEEEVRVIKDRLDEGDTHQEISDDYDISRTTITLISNGDHWSHV